MTRRDAVSTAVGVGLGAALGPRCAEATPPAEGWPLWESYAARFLSDDGRVIDPDAEDATTSEGQSYAAFFALVADDRDRFDRILAWTDRHLAGGRLGERLPAWLWGRDQTGREQVKDPNSASDSDVWIAYTLLEAGRIWKDPALTAWGETLATTAERREVVDLRGLGPMLLPAPAGFNPSPGVYQLNASYLPLQALWRLADALPGSAWGAVAAATPAVLAGSSRQGFVLDWVAYWEGGGFRDEPLPRSEAKASYDAIRVYLWAGMLHPDTPGRADALSAMPGMERSLRLTEAPPAEVMADGEVRDPHAGVGFSAALLPYLDALGALRAAQQQRRRVDGLFDPIAGLYGRPAKYYDQNLVLFALGWSEGRFGFDARGRLQVRRSS